MYSGYNMPVQGASYFQQSMPGSPSYEQAKANFYNNFAQPVSLLHGAGYNANPYYNQAAGSQGQQQYYSFTKSGYNPLGSDVVMPTDAMIRQLEYTDDYNTQMQNYLNNNPYAASYNYYGFMNYTDPSIQNNYNQRMMELKEEGIRNRIRLNQRLSQAVHTFLNDKTPEQQLALNQIYENQTIHRSKVNIDYEQKKAVMQSLVPVNNVVANPYYNTAYNSNQVSQEYKKYFRKGGDLNHFFNGLSEMSYQNKLRELQKKQRNINKIGMEAFASFFSAEYMRRERELGNDTSALTNLPQNATSSDVFDALLKAFPETRKALSLQLPQGCNIDSEGVLNINYPGNDKTDIAKAMADEAVQGLPTTMFNPAAHGNNIPLEIEEYDDQGGIYSYEPEISQEELDRALYKQSIFEQKRALS